MSVELYIRPDARNILAANGLDSLDAFMNLRSAEFLDKPGLASWRRRSRLVLPDGNGQQRTYYLKRYDQPPPARRWRRLFGGGERAMGLAACEVVQMDALHAAGIPAVRWAAWGQELDGTRERRSFVLTEAVPGEALERWLPNTFAHMSPSRRESLKPRILEKLLELVCRFHEAGFAHRDLYSSHIFIEVVRGGGVQLRLIDLQRVFRPRNLKTRWRVKDLAQLDYSLPTWFASRSDRLRWLRSYLRAGKLNDEHKRFVLRVVRKSGRIARHDARRLE